MGTERVDGVAGEAREASRVSRCSACGRAFRSGGEHALVAGRPVCGRCAELLSGDAGAAYAKRSFIAESLCAGLTVVVSLALMGTSLGVYELAKLHAPQQLTIGASPVPEPGFHYSTSSGGAWVLHPQGSSPFHGVVVDFLSQGIALVALLCAVVSFVFLLMGKRRRALYWPLRLLVGLVACGGVVCAVDCALASRDMAELKTAAGIAPSAIRDARGDAVATYGHPGPVITVSAHTDRPQDVFPRIVGEISEDHDERIGFCFVESLLVVLGGAALWFALGSARHRRMAFLQRTEPPRGTDKRPSGKAGQLQPAPDS